MSALTEAEAARDAAHEVYSGLVSTESRLRSEAADLRQRVTSGEGEAVSAAALAEADKVAHAALQIGGAEQKQRELSAAVTAARDDERCDVVVERLPELGADVMASLETLATVLDEVAKAVVAYDSFAEAAARQLSVTMSNSPRVNITRYSGPAVDRMSLASCRGASQVAVALLPAVTAIGAPSGFLDALRQLAAAAPAIPTT
jgi:hypothetical protein